MIALSAGWAFRACPAVGGPPDRAASGPRAFVTPDLTRGPAPSARGGAGNGIPGQDRDDGAGGALRYPIRPSGETRGRSLGRAGHVGAVSRALHSGRMDAVPSCSGCDLRSNAACPPARPADALLPGAQAARADAGNLAPGLGVWTDAMGVRHPQGRKTPGGARRSGTTRPRPPSAQMWIGLPCTAIAASFSASAWVGWAWQV